MKTAVITRKTGIRLSLVALFAALTAAGTFISIPLPFSPVPIVLQNMFALLAGLLLGPWLGCAAVGFYLVAGLIGAPIFAGASGGIAHILTPSGGYLFGYFLAAVTAGLIAGMPRADRKTALWRLICAATAGLLIVYVPGVARLKFVLDASWGRAVAAGFVPFVIGDAIKGAVAVIIAARLRPLVADNLER
ncbi:BioY family transporter [Spirochaetia bacterium]|nr:BioY family transporter [Spirochaetia bacterium]